MFVMKNINTGLLAFDYCTIHSFKGSHHHASVDVLSGWSFD
jgi:hypothetical protein